MVERKMKVLLLADGLCEHTLRYKNALKKAGVDVLLGALERGPVVDVPFRNRTGIQFADYALIYRDILKTAREYSPDIVNPHFACGYGFSAALSGIWRQYPAIMHCLGSDILVSPGRSIINRKRVVYALSRISDIIVDSRYLGEEAKKLYAGLNYKVIYWGADEKAFVLHWRKKGPGFMKAAPLRILTPRPHKEVYNNAFVVKALKELIHGRRVAITFPAWGESRPKFNRTIKRECPDGLISFYDYMVRDRYLELLSGFDVYLSASTSDSSPASLLEAMAVGLYPVVADIPGVGEWMNHHSGKLFRLDDPGSLKTAIGDLLEAGPGISETIERNHREALSRARYTDNINRTIEIMEDRIRSGRR
jgi:glycosyltransferase involved in cell wall biosynthesis